MEYSGVISCWEWESPLLFQANWTLTPLSLDLDGLHLHLHLPFGKESGKLYLMGWFQLANDFPLDTISKRPGFPGSKEENRPAQSSSSVRNRKALQKAHRLWSDPRPGYKSQPVNSLCLPPSWTYHLPVVSSWHLSLYNLIHVFVYVFTVCLFSTKCKFYHSGDSIYLFYHCISTCQTIRYPLNISWMWIMIYTSSFGLTIPWGCNVFKYLSSLSVCALRTGTGSYSLLFVLCLAKDLANSRHPLSEKLN